MMAVNVNEEERKACHHYVDLELQTGNHILAFLVEDPMGQLSMTWGIPESEKLKVMPHLRLYAEQGAALTADLKNQEGPAQ